MYFFCCILDCLYIVNTIFGLSFALGSHDQFLVLSLVNPKKTSFCATTKKTFCDKSRHFVPKDTILSQKMIYCAKIHHFVPKDISLCQKTPFCAKIRQFVSKNRIMCQKKLLPAKRLYFVSKEAILCQKTPFC